MKDNERLKLKTEALANLKYRKVIEPSAENQGRSVADVPSKTWADGERSRLRPNSIWADERYADITQKEVDEAKERVKKRNLSRGVKEDRSVHFEAYVHVNAIMWRVVFKELRGLTNSKGIVTHDLNTTNKS